MKYLIIAAIVGLVFVVVYSRLRPYLQLILKVVNSLNVSASVGSSTVSPQNRAGENKLVRCAACETWVPEERALNLRSGLATYCSPECLEKKSATRERKLAG
ncbi:MAG TPA: hypothetical protein VGQ39_25355 [Pyrinomonadaceae bacterium]|nr:hypothetical protein [Pyrinomonadaceae bacterium]